MTNGSVRTAVVPRALAIASVALLHVLVYFSVTRLTELRPAGAFIHPHIGLDDRIPHLPWTWPAYWLPYVLVPVAAGMAIGRLDPPAFGRLIAAWSGMIILGGTIQVIWPAVAPWPPSPAFTQRLYHASPLILPYATLPSMHVAHVAMAALLAGTVFPSRRVQASGWLAVVTVAVATLTLKEHVMLDAITGMALAAGAWSWWRRGMR